MFNYLVFLLLFSLPLFFLPHINLPFELPKMVLFRVITFLMFFIFMKDFIKSKTVSLPDVFKNKKVRLALVLFLAVLGISTLFSISPGQSFWGSYYRMQGAYSFLHYFLFFLLLCLKFEKREQWETALKFMFAGFIMAFIYGGLQKFVNFNDIHPLLEIAYDRVFSSFAHPSYFANYALLIIFPLGGLFLKKRKYWLIAGLIAAGILIMFWTKSRSSFLALAIGLIFYLTVYAIKFKRKKILVMVVVLGVLSGLTILGPNLYPRLFPQDSFLHRMRLEGENLRSLQVRPETWKAAIKMAADKPLFGNGLESFPLLIEKYADPRLAELEPQNALPDRAYNVFFQIMADTGIFGLAFFLFTLALIFRLALSHKSEITIGILSSFIAFLFADSFGFAVTVHMVMVAFLLAYLCFLISNKRIPKDILHNIP